MGREWGENGARKGAPVQLPRHVNRVSNVEDQRCCCVVSGLKEDKNNLRLASGGSNTSAMRLDLY